MKLFCQYIKQRGKGIMAFFLFCIIFAVTFALYHFPLSSVLYPAILCAVIGLLFMICDFAKVYKNHKTLLIIQKLSAALISDLPETNSIESQDYQLIIKSLKEEQAQLQTEMNNRYADMVDYYTTWAHQIKTPIASMGLMLQNEDSQLSRKLSADLFRIEQYVEMVLAFLRLSSYSTDYVIKEYDLDDIIKQSVKKFAGEFISRKIRLEYQSVCKKVLTDEKWLSFVIEQVLSNALKYTQQGSVSIYLEGSEILCIQDTGIGIAAEDLPRIFEKGYTGYNGRADKKASGLGLYLCQKICDKLGHSIKADSVLEKGTVIRIGLERKNIQIE